MRTSVSPSARQPSCGSVCALHNVAKPVSHRAISSLKSARLLMGLLKKSKPHLQSSLQSCYLMHVVNRGLVPVLLVVWSHIVNRLLNPIFYTAIPSYMSSSTLTHRSLTDATASQTRESAAWFQVTFLAFTQEHMAACWARSGACLHAAVSLLVLLRHHSHSRCLSSPIAIARGCLDQNRTAEHLQATTRGQQLPSSRGTGPSSQTTGFYILYRPD